MNEPTGDNKPRIVFSKIERFEPLTPKYIAPTYEQIIGNDSYSTIWQEKMIKLSQLPEKEVREHIQLLLLDRHPKTASWAWLDWRRNNTVMDRANFSMLSLDHISGNKIKIPVFGFRKDDYLAFLKQAGLKVAQGYSMQLPMNDARSRPLSVVTYSTDYIEGYMSPEQIRQHELVHSVDPNLGKRNNHDGVLISEMAAVIGEITGGGNDMVRVATEAGFWRGYTDRIPRYSDSCISVLGMSRTESTNSTVVAQRMSEHVKKITNRNNNTQLVLGLMNCRSFDDYSAMYAELNT